MTFFPTIELYDRLAIAEVKWERTNANAEELDWYKRRADGLTEVRELYEDLKDIHRQIWDLEKELKSGKEQSLPLDEIGRRAIAIRDLNNKRILLKNTMADRLGDPVKEIKKEHLSE